MPRLKDLYVKDVAPALMKKYSYKSTMQIPRLEKIVINCGCGCHQDMSMHTQSRRGEDQQDPQEGWPGKGQIHADFIWS